MTNDFIKAYKEQRDRLRQAFEAKRTGEQALFIDQSMLLKPLIETQKETSKAIQDKIASTQNDLTNTLVPFVTEINRKNDFRNLPFGTNLDIPEIEQIPQSTPKKDQSLINVELDGELLNETHSENLQDMGLDLPSVVLQKRTVESTLKQIVSENRRNGQFLGKGSKKSEQEKQIYRSRDQTLEVYERKIKGLDAAKQFIIPKKLGEGLKLVKRKRNRGRPRKYPVTLFYKHPDELAKRLNELVIARAAGNTGLDNYINSVLDELLNTKVINKDAYDKLFKNIFSTI